MVREDLYRLRSRSLQLLVFYSEKEQAGGRQRPYVGTNEERRLHESPGSEVSFGFFMCQIITISAGKMCRKAPELIDIATYISSYGAGSLSVSAS